MQNTSQTDKEGDVDVDAALVVRMIELQLMKIK